MTNARLEHVNLTVSDPERSAALIERVFGWQVRWRGPAMSGRTVHVGTDRQYLAFYATRPDVLAPELGRGRLNHVAIEVDDLDATEARVIEAGLTPFNHGDYQPGRRFYFYDGDEIEFEIVCYQPAAVTRDPLLEPA